MNFLIWRRGADEFIPAEMLPGGFQQSAVLQAGFRMDQTQRTDGRWQYDWLQSTP